MRSARLGWRNCAASNRTARRGPQRARRQLGRVRQPLRSPRRPHRDDLPDEQVAAFFVNPATAIVMTQRVLQVSSALLLQTGAGSALAAWSSVRQTFRLPHYQTFVRRKELADE